MPRQNPYTTIGRHTEMTRGELLLEKWRLEGIIKTQLSDIRAAGESLRELRAMSILKFAWYKLTKWRYRK